MCADALTLDDYDDDDGGDDEAVVNRQFQQDKKVCDTIDLQKSSSTT